MLVHVAAMSEDLRVGLNTNDEFDTLIETNSQKLTKYFGKGHYRLQPGWAMVMKGGNKGIREALDPFKDVEVHSTELLGLFICRRKKIMGKDVTYVVLQGTESDGRYCNQFVHVATAWDTEQKSKIQMKEVIAALEHSYKE